MFSAGAQAQEFNAGPVGGAPVEEHRPIGGEGLEGGAVEAHRPVGGEGLEGGGVEAHRPIGGAPDVRRPEPPAAEGNIEAPPPPPPPE